MTEEQEVEGADEEVVSRLERVLDLLDEVLRDLAEFKAEAVEGVTASKK